MVVFQRPISDCCRHPLTVEIPLTATVLIGAGDENRTRVVSLEDWGSTIELRPRAVPTVQGLVLRGVSLMPAVLRFEIRPPMQRACWVEREERRAVAQLGSALRLGRRCRRFKSCQPDQYFRLASQSAQLSFFQAIRS